MKFLIVLSALLVAAYAQTPTNNVINEAECGERPLATTNIVGGVESKSGAQPHIISMEYRSSSVGTFSHSCGGSVINKNWIVTAAHCVAGRSAGNLRIQIGSQIRNQQDEFQETRFVSRIVSHPSYSSSTYKNDIALLLLDSPISKYNDYVRPICLPDSSDTIGSGNTAIASGWGTTSSGASTLPFALREVELPVTKESEVIGQYGSSYDATTMIGFGVVGDRKDTCQGDSGGPVIMKSTKINNKWTLYGITSWGYGCGDIGVYTRASNYYDWIKQQLNAY